MLCHAWEIWLCEIVKCKAGSWNKKYDLTVCSIAESYHLTMYVLSYKQHFLYLTKF